MPPTCASIRREPDSNKRRPSSRRRWVWTPGTRDRHAADMDQDEMLARQAQGQALAPSLVGLDRQTAVDRICEADFLAQPIPATAETISASLNFNRIRRVCCTNR